MYRLAILVLRSEQSIMPIKDHTGASCRC